MMTIISKLKKNFFAMAGIAVGILLLICFLFVVPKGYEVKRLRQEVDDLRAESQRIENLILVSKNVGQKLQDTQKMLTKYQSMIRSETELSDVISDIASQAANCGLEVSYLKPLKNEIYTLVENATFKAQGQKIVEVILSMKASGRFLASGRYLEALENGPYKMLVKAVNLTLCNEVEVKPGREPVLWINMTIGILMKSSGTGKT